MPKNTILISLLYKQVSSPINSPKSRRQLKHILPIKTVQITVKQ